jgi:hypothetical protein
MRLRFSDVRGTHPASLWQPPDGIPNQVEALGVASLIQVNSYDVDPPILVRCVLLLQIDLAQLYQLSLLSWGDALFCGAEAVPSACSHFDKDQGFSLAGHNVQLSSRTTPVSGKDEVTLPLEVGGGNLFTPLA